MALTNSQYDAIMRQYDSIRTENQHIQNQRYEEVSAACPELHEIENDIISLSISTAASFIKQPDVNNAKNPTVDNAESHYQQQLAELSAKRADCLKRLGLPDNYLDDIYTCPQCHDTGYIGQHKCSCFNRKAIDLVYRESNLKNIIANENFATFSYDWYDKTNVDSTTKLTPYNNMQKVVSICHSFVDNFDNDFSNLLLFGNTGVGKTFLSNCIAKELLDSSHSVIYLTAVELFEKFKNKDFNRQDSSKDDFDSSYILDCDLLIIDDLGTESPNSYTNSRLFYCINERILRRKSTVISTNYSLQNIRDVYSERIFSRLTSCYSIVYLFGDDIRLLKRTGIKK